MDSNHFDRLARTLVGVGTRRTALRVLLALPLGTTLAAWLDGETPVTQAAGRRRRRKKQHHHQQGNGKENRKGKQKGKDKGKDKCTKAGQSPQKGNPCCEGLVKDGAGQCAHAAGPTCAQTCSGCCDDQTCVTEMSDSACGTGGAACGTCSGLTGICFNGTCACDVCASGCPFTTVQAAVAAASPGDTITICAGTYVGTTMITKNLTLHGAGDGDDPTSDTILDGNDAGTVITVNAGVTASVSGLRITKGRNNLGGGGVHNPGDLTMTKCTIIDNVSTSADGGGGLHNQGASSSLTMIDCTVTQNRFTGSSVSSAAGIFNQGRLAMTGCTLSGNTSRIQLSAGGIRHGNVTSTITTLTNCVVGPDNAAGIGGGIYATSGGTVELIGTTVQGNSAQSSSGGGIVVDPGTTLRLRSNSRVQNNSTAANGGGIRNQGGTVELDNSVVGPNNTAAGNGGGILNESVPGFTGTVMLSGNSSVEENHADGDGGGIFNRGIVIGCGTENTVSDNTAGNAMTNNCFNAPASGPLPAGSGCESCPA